MRVTLPAVLVFLIAVVVRHPTAESIIVPAKGDLQAALNKARPGDTILLERDATYVGNFVLPAAKGDDDRVITLRTAGEVDNAGDGQRISPASAEHLARLRSPSGGAPALKAAAGARGWRITLVEFQANHNGAGDIIALGDGGAAQDTLDRVPSDLTLDRVYIHGDPEKGQKRGIALNSSKTTIVNCYISDIKAIGQDSQAIAGWNGPGDYVIQNNYLEAAGENLMFGGADPAIPDLTPSKIVIRDNLLSKPLEWREPGAPKWQIKNLLELKNARAVVIEHNVLERSWQQAQAGNAVLFTVRNQDGRCPWCQVEDVQFRGNLVRDVAAGFQVLGTDPIHPSRQTNRIVIRDNVFDGIDKRAWGGDGYFMLLTDAPRDVVVDHNTIVQGASGGLLKIAHGVTEGFTMTNNIASHGNYGIIGRDHSVGNDSIAVYLPGAKIVRNVIAGAKKSAYPADNLFPSADDLRREFVNAEAHDFHLAPRSAWRGAGTDGRDLGANLGLVPDAPRQGSGSRD